MTGPCRYKYRLRGCFSINLNGVPWQGEVVMRQTNHRKIQWSRAEGPEMPSSPASLANPIRISPSAGKSSL